MLPVVTMEARVVADPELRFSPSGVAVAKIRCVASSRKKNEAGEWVDDKNCWLNVTAFKKLAENIAESVGKGDLINVTGRLQTDEWEDKQTGEKKSAPSLIADTVAVSLAFRVVPHSGNATERVSGPVVDDPWASGPAPTQQAGSAAVSDPWTPSSATNDPPF